MTGIAIGVLSGALVIALIWAITDRDILYKIGRIKLKGSGHHLNLSLATLPPGVKKRHIRRLERLKRKLGQ